MSSLDDVSDWISARLPGLIEEHGVPAAAIAVLHDGEVSEFATGLLSTTTGVEATTDSVFQIGSITKVWTATLVMQLAEEGQLDIDDQVRRHLPEFQVGDESAAAAITIRQLLSHTAGFEGDIFKDTGNGDDCVEKYLRELVDVPQLFPPGELFSYNNAAYCVLGRLVEVLRGKPYDQCLRQHLLDPLELTHAATDAYEAIMFRAAVGHVRHAGQEPWQPADVWTLPRSNGPAGSMLAMRPRDLLAFARMHMESGTAPAGDHVLRAETAAAMTEQQVRVPDLGYMGNAWGLGWELYPAGSVSMLGHDGNTIGQAATLRIVPERGLAVVLLTNGGNYLPVYHEVVGHVLRELAGVELPDFPSPPAEPPAIDASRYVGTYAAEVMDLVVTQDDDRRIWLVRTPKGIFEGEPAQRQQMVPYADDALIPLEPEDSMYLPHVFVGDDGEGHAQYLHVGRAIRRVPADQ